MNGKYKNMQFLLLRANSCKDCVCTLVLKLYEMWKNKEKPQKDIIIKSQNSPELTDERKKLTNKEIERLEKIEKARENFKE